MWHKERICWSTAVTAALLAVASIQASSPERSGIRGSESTPEALYASSSERRKPIGETPPVSGRASINSLRLSEVMYHPLEGGAEFLELTNTGARRLLIGGVRFTDEIDSTFPPSTILAPGEHAVIAASEADFVAAYPGVAFAGEYSGALSNAGETLTIEHPAPPAAELWKAGPLPAALHLPTASAATTTASDNFSLGLDHRTSSLSGSSSSSSFSS